MNDDRIIQVPAALDAIRSDTKRICFSGRLLELGTGTGIGTAWLLSGMDAGVRLGPTAEELFERLLDACEALAGAQGLPRLEAGVNMARHEAYRTMLARGFRTDIQGVAMHRSNEPGYNRPGVYLIDDWR